MMAMQLPVFLRRFWTTSGDERGMFPEPQLRDVILFVTDRCNLRCKHCMFWERIDSPGAEMPLDNLQKIARSIPALRTVVLTGGEPFLRKDIAQIVETFYAENRCCHLQIDSNGLVIESMVDLVEKDIAAKYQSHLSFQISLDGFEEKHEAIRQAPGSFTKTVANIKRLVALKKDHPFFRIVVLTNINKNNYNDIEALSDFLSNDVGVDHAFDIVRGSGHSSWGIPKEIITEENPRDCDFPPLDELQRIMDLITRIDEREGGVHAQFVRQLQYQVDLYLGRPIPFRCLTAGRTIGTIYSNGAVAACEFTKPFAHLEDYQYDLNKLWQSQFAEERRNQIKGCRCCHSCFVLTSMEEWENQISRNGIRP
jgi:MoaA/NifB/PqqE/SkfB family radical SAM enzyme